MNFALIDPMTQVTYVSSWDLGPPITPNTETYLNSARVAEVSAQKFDVCEPYFWVACSSETIADVYYYDTAMNTFAEVVNAPYPEFDQPVSTGAQPL